jgi:hypothetical protein
MDNDPARRVGAALARLLKRRISKGRAKGTDGTNVPVWGAMRRLAKVNVFKNCEAIFFLFLGGVTGAEPPLRGEA